MKSAVEDAQKRDEGCSRRGSGTWGWRRRANDMPPFGALGRRRGKGGLSAEETTLANWARQAGPLKESEVVECPEVNFAGVDAPSC